MPKSLVNSCACLRCNLPATWNVNQAASGAVVSAGHPVQTESKGLVVQRLARGLISLSSVFVSARPLSEGHERALLFCVHETNRLQQGWKREVRFTIQVASMRLTSMCFRKVNFSSSFVR